MTLPKPPDKIIARACGRGWTNDDIATLRGMWNSPAWRIKEIACHFGVKSGSMGAMRTRRALGLGIRPNCKGPRGKIPIPLHAHPLVRFIVRRMNADLMTFEDVERRSGVDASTVHHWRDSNPRIHNLEAVLNVLGYRLKIVPLAQEEEQAA